jgi:ABC-type sugar transport system ATPase subunit
VELFGGELPICVRRQPGSALTLGLRPEAITPAAVGTSRPGFHAVHGRLRRSENLGAEHILHVDLASPASGGMICSMAGNPETLIDDTRGLALLFAPAACHVFDADGRRVGDAEPVALAGEVPTLARAL